MIFKLLDENLFAIAPLRPKLLAASAEIVADNGICRIQNRFRRTVILLELDNRGIRHLFIEMQDIFNGCAAEFIDALVVVTDNHEIPISAGKQNRQLKLRIIGILKFIYKHIFEFALIIGADILIFTEQHHGFHDDVVKIHRHGFFKPSLIQRIKRGYLLELIIAPDLRVEIMRGHETVLRHADLIHDEFGGNHLFIDVQLLHAVRDDLFRVVRIVYGKAFVKAELIRM